ncbi:hypothetical protein LPJ78_003376 [Coemansia sp. RSA 989]|nr:hypothetical protein BX667DRAFT_499005 [Coemansia mojavensis]KAJ1740670.1 hypothetical protein LPJ68_003557 [Coemansia sp. RSA 1086]KAJ1749257.1 hypothetical protein LPJ79_003857 [Coemansia sp. RSA 1821]KAJ1864422.1 hypothetical protein LPJ78_003376 [Coemansia sp. RSA 989]KAJ1871112.1 hypothetical protein LPJ55_004131 [Coemansia sp. RSA 990]KAJ2632792.1 hypothetical protein H4R22_000978 [Coemansia sp. RSA 1290]KAJ2647120.1 hypothetical protein IWW40_004918 [Coemansia sp. RSA 1250]KAJ26689
MSKNIPISNSKEQQQQQTNIPISAANNAQQWGAGGSRGFTPGSGSGSFFGQGIEAPPNSYANQHMMPIQGRQMPMFSGPGSLSNQDGLEVPPNSLANQSMLHGRQGFGSMGTDVPPNSLASQRGIPMQGRQAMSSTGTDAPPNSYANQSLAAGSAGHGISNSFITQKLCGMGIVHERDETAADAEDDEMSGTSPSQSGNRRPSYADNDEIFKMD